METKQQAIKVTKEEEFNEMYKGSFYTITGAGGDIQEWVDGYTEMLEKENIGTPIKFYTFKGIQINEQYNLGGEVAYPKDLTFITFSLEGLDTGKLAIFKLAQGDRWFDDIVDNDRRHMDT